MCFPTNVVYHVYSLRWQVELVFKGIKSHCGFESSAGQRKQRIECQLYERLTSLVIALFLMGKFRQQLWRSSQRQLSLLKCFAHLPIVVPMILGALSDSQKLKPVLVEIAAEMMRLCQMEKRPNRLSTVQMLQTITESMFEAAAPPT